MELADLLITTAIAVIGLYLTNSLRRWCETPVKPNHQQWAIRVVGVELFNV